MKFQRLMMRFIIIHFHLPSTVRPIKCEATISLRRLAAREMCGTFSNFCNAKVYSTLRSLVRLQSNFCQSTRKQFSIAWRGIGAGCMPHAYAMRANNNNKIRENKFNLCEYSPAHLCLALSINCLRATREEYIKSSILCNNSAAAKQMLKWNWMGAECGKWILNRWFAFVNCNNRERKLLLAKDIYGANAEIHNSYYQKRSHVLSPFITIGPFNGCADRSERVAGQSATCRNWPFVCFRYFIIFPI